MPDVERAPVLPAWWGRDHGPLRDTLRRFLRTRFDDEGLQAIDAALATAAEGHAAQTRAGGEAYIVHPIRVCASLLIEFEARDPDLLKAGLLHDVVEDSELGAAEIAARFGTEVARLVSAVTRTAKRPKGGDRIDAPYLQTIIRGGREAILLKLADKLDNVRDLLNHPSAEKRRSSVRECHEVYLAMVPFIGDGPTETRVARLLTTALENHAFYRG